MAVITPAGADRVETMDGFEGRFTERDGIVVAFETYTADADPAELFRGLPGDRCQCPHHGYVLRGELIFRYADGTEDRITAGQAYTTAPGHLRVFTAGTEIVEFSPAAEMAETMRVVLANLTKAETEAEPGIQARAEAGAGAGAER